MQDVPWLQHRALFPRCHCSKGGMTMVLDRNFVHVTETSEFYSWWDGSKKDLLWLVVEASKLNVWWYCNIGVSWTGSIPKATSSQSSARNLRSAGLGRKHCGRLQVQESFINRILVHLKYFEIWGFPKIGVAQIIHFYRWTFPTIPPFWVMWSKQ